MVLPDELIDHTRDFRACNGPDADLPGAVDGLREATADLGVSQQARDDRGAAVPSGAALAHIDPEQVSLDRPDRQAVRARWSEVAAHS